MIGLSCLRYVGAVYAVTFPSTIVMLPSLPPALTFLMVWVVVTFPVPSLVMVAGGVLSAGICGGVFTM
jgi:hypothetical protein